ncbi:MAG: hypothetical protein QXO03_03455 [Thermoplasmatales archaeon]
MIRKDGSVGPIECKYSDVEFRQRMKEKLEAYEDLIFATFPSFLGRIPKNAAVLLIPPVGDSSEPEFIESAKA